MKSEAHIGNDSLFIGGVHSDNRQENNISPEAEKSKVDIGNDNTFTGGVHVTDDHTNNESNSNSKNTVHTNSHNTINTTTIYEAVKSNSERLKEDELNYRSKCKELYTNGLISKEDENKLRELQKRLDLADELAASIKDEIRQQSIKRISPTAAVISGIRQTKAIIEQNSDVSLRRQLNQLEAWMREYEDDSLKMMYYQMSSMLEPLQYISRYEKSAKDEYWEVYWAYIAYMLQDNEKQAFDARASLGRWQTVYPDQNDVILHLAGRLMQNDTIGDIQLNRNTLTPHYTRDLKPLLDAVDELLKMDWTKESIVIRPTRSFYINTLFASFVNTQKSIGEERRHKNIQIDRAEREKQNEIKRQKEFLLQKFQDVENIEKACKELGLPYLTFRVWLEDDITFNSSYYEIVHSIEKRTSEEAEKTRIAHEIETQTRQQKSRFKYLYEKNNCDLFQTCSELDIDSGTVGKWRESDNAFDDALTTIEREKERRRQNTFVKFYELNGCDIRKACAETGISQDTVNDWRRSNKAFDETLTSIESESERAIQDAFVKSYEANDCDIQKTCAEIGLTPELIWAWRETDKGFNNKVYSINRQRFIRRFKKFLPYILIIVLLCAFGYGYQLKRERDLMKIEEEHARIEQTVGAYNKKFDYSLSSVSKDAATDNDIEHLREAASIVIKMRVENLENYVGDKIKRITDKADELLAILDNTEELVKQVSGSELEKTRIENRKERINEIISELKI